MKDEVIQVKEKLEKLIQMVNKPSRENRHLNIALKEIKFLLAYIGD